MTSVKFNNILLVITVYTLSTMQNSTSSPIETEKLDTSTNQFDRMQAEMGKLAEKFRDLEAENKELKLHNSQQDKEILGLKNYILNSEIVHPNKATSNYAMDQFPHKIDVPLIRALGRPPSSCQEWLDGSPVLLSDGIYLIQNMDTRKIEAMFCQKTANNRLTFSQVFIGNVDVKTKSIHFYVQRNTPFRKNSSDITWELARLNEGGAFNLASGIFTAPVPGIYHFEFFAVKDATVTYSYINLAVNGASVCVAYTEPYVKGSKDSLSLSASLRLKANDRVNLYNGFEGELYDDANHRSHFSGWLVEEDLM